MEEERTVLNNQKHEQKKSEVNWSRVAIGGSTGILMGTATAAIASALRNKGDEAGILEVPTDNPSQTMKLVSTSDGFSFGQAFNDARNKLGAGGVFEWRGKLYNTYKAEEWKQMTDEAKNDFAQKVQPHIEDSTTDTETETISDKVDIIEDPENRTQDPEPGITQDVEDKKNAEDDKADLADTEQKQQEEKSDEDSEVEKSDQKEVIAADEDKDIAKNETEPVEGPQSPTDETEIIEGQQETTTKETEQNSEHPQTPMNETDPIDELPGNSEDVTRGLGEDFQNGQTEVPKETPEEQNMLAELEQNTDGIVTSQDDVAHGMSDYMEGGNDGL